MLVKCFSCGNTIDFNDAVDIHKNGCHKYYCNKCSEEALSEQRVMSLCDEIIGHHVFDHQLEYRINILAKSYSFSMIAEYLVNNLNDLSNVFYRKEFESERHKVNYLCVVIENQIVDFADKHEVQIKMDVEPEFYDIRYTPRKRKRSLSEFEGDMN